MLFRVVEENLRAAMRCYAAVTAKGEARDYPGLVLASTGIDCAVFNSAMLTGLISSEGLRQLARTAHLHFAQRGLGWTFWLCEDLLDNGTRAQVTPLFRELGMPGIAQAPGMYADRLKPPGRRLNSIECRRVSNPATRLDFAHLSSIIFSLPFKSAKEIYCVPQLWKSPLTGWVGYYQGSPIALVSVVVAAGAAGVYSLGTLPEYQRRGFGEAILRYALAEAYAETGCETTVLQSTRQGMNLYTRLGYRPVTQFAIYLNEGCSAF